MAIRAKRQGLDASDGGQIEIAVKMRKQSPATRRLPFQSGAKLARVNTDQQQIALTGKVLGSGLHNLGRSGKMNEIVSSIDLGAAEYTGSLCFPPECGRTNFIQCLHSYRPSM